jgi:hypothetical protein
MMMKVSDNKQKTERVQHSTAVLHKANDNKTGMKTNDERHLSTLYQHGWHGPAAPLTNNPQKRPILYNGLYSREAPLTKKIDTHTHIHTHVQNQ